MVEPWMMVVLRLAIWVATETSDDCCATRAANVSAGLARAGASCAAPSLAAGAPAMAAAARAAPPRSEAGLAPSESGVAPGAETATSILGILDMVGGDG